MNDAFLRLIEKIIKGFVWVYRDAIDFVEECDLENMNMVEIDATSQNMQAHEIY